MFASSSKELSCHEPMDTGKSAEKSTNKRSAPPYTKLYLFDYSVISHLGTF